MNVDAQAHAILQSWSNPVGLDLALCLTALVYARGWFRLRATFPNLISLWRLAAFFCGIIFVWIAIRSPLNAFDDALLTVHMLQHLLLMSVAPPLILLGAPQLPLLHGLPQFFARNLTCRLLLEKKTRSRSPAAPRDRKLKSWAIITGREFSTMRFGGSSNASTPTGRIRVLARIPG